MTAAASSARPGRRGTFGPVVLAGAAATALAAVGATRTWATLGNPRAGAVAGGLPPLTGTDVNPLVGALALVSLASWGTVLVLRGRARRGAAVLGLVASLGALLALLTSLLGSTVAGALARTSGVAAADVIADRTAWPYVTGLGLVVALGAFALAVRDAPGWPAMSSRYDAPTGAASPTGAVGPDRARPGDGEAAPPEGDERALWRALDEGRDPTE